MNYGVELEFVFAFREDELDLGVNKLKKNVPYERRAIYPNFSLMDPAKLPDRIYNSWAVADQRTRRIRPYAWEPQQILKRHLDEKRPWIPTRVEGTLLANEKRTDIYDEWLITPEHTVCGVGLDKISESLPDKEILPSENNWDSYGLELVSPVFESNCGAGKTQIQQLLESTVGDADDYYGAFVTEQCGVHVHVEAPKDLRVLQELALLLVIYEEAISALHAPHRRPGHPATIYILESNRLWWMYDDDSDFDASTAALAKKYTISQLRDHFRFIKDKKSLARRMCYPKNPERPQSDRNRLVNFTYLTRGKGFPETIEFRQAAGTLDAEEISHWIDFCIDLVRFAKICAKDPERFPIKNWETLPDGTLRSLGVVHLMRAMGYNKESVRFWKKKVKGNYGLRLPSRGATTLSNVHTNSTERRPQKRHRLGGSSERDFDEISNNRKHPRSTRITETFEQEMTLDESDIVMTSPPSDVPGGPFTVFPPQRHYELGSPKYPNSRFQADSHTSSQRKSLSGGIRKNTRPLAGSNSRAYAGRTRFQTSPYWNDYLSDVYGTLDEISNTRTTASDHSPTLTPTPSPGGTPSSDLLPLSPNRTSTDRKTVLPIPKEHRAPGKIAEEAMSRDEFSWYVTDFDNCEWEDIRNGSFIDGRTGCCGLLALSRAFQEQYPQETWGDVSSRELLRIYDKVTPSFRRDVFASDDEMQDVVNVLTGGEIALVIPQHKSQDISERARRMGDPEIQGNYARNLYLRHLIWGHWEPMRKRRKDGGIEGESMET